MKMACFQMVSILLCPHSPEEETAILKVVREVSRMMLLVNILLFIPHTLATMPWLSRLTITSIHPRTQVAQIFFLALKS